MSASRAPRSAPAILSVLLAVGVVACTPAPTPSPTALPTAAPSIDREATGIDGRVVDPGGNVVAGAEVTLVLGEFVGTTRTTSDGTFRDRGSTGVIEITATLEGYRSAQQTVTVAPNEIVEVELVLVPEGG